MYIRFSIISMQELNLPNYSLKLKKEGNKNFIFDSIRKKYLVLTPEEWVRQNFIQFLIQEKGYPASLIAIEMGIDVLNTKKRCDIVLFNNEGKAHIIVECKAPSIKISQDTFDQIARYNLTLKTDLLIVTNGLEHYTCIMDHENERYQFVKEIPEYKT
jgi:hypothetical protein